MRPTLIIGIGGTGMKIGHVLKNMFWNYNKTKLNNYIKFIFIENDQTEIKKINKFISDPRVYNTNEIFQINNFNPGFTVVNIKKRVEGEPVRLSEREEDVYSWIDFRNKEYPNSAFTGGLNANRQLGRLALAENFESLSRKINTAIGELTKVGNVANVKNAEVAVYIISGITGGTGSSMFLDVSLMVDVISKGDGAIKKKAVFTAIEPYLDAKKVRGYVETDLEYINLQMNGIALIKECEFFVENAVHDNQLLARYSCRPSLTKPLSGVNYSPFDSGWFFSNRTSTNSQITEMDEFYKSIGNTLYYTLASTSNDSFKSEIEVNAFGAKITKNKVNNANNNVNISEGVKYGTVGYKTIRFPREEFQEYFNARYMYDLFNDKLLNRNFKQKEINREAADFINNFFGEEEQNYLTQIINSARLFNQDYAYLTSEIQPSSFYEEKGLIFKNNVLKEAGNLYSLLESHSGALNRFEEFANNVVKKMSKQLTFGKIKEENLDEESWEFKIRDLFENKFYDIIVKYGYYALVGISEDQKKGFIELVRDRLRTIFLEVKTKVGKLSQSGNSLSSYKDVLIKNAGEDEEEVSGYVEEYITSLKKAAENVRIKAALSLKMKLLYEISAADDMVILEGTGMITKEKTLLNELTEEKEIAVGIKSSDNKNLEKLFGGESKKTSSIKNRYLVQLVNRFLMSDSNLFDIILPKPLSQYVGSGKKGKIWKKETELDKLYTEYIMPELDLDKIFPKRDKTNVELLGDLGNDYSTELNEDIESIVQKAQKHFKNKFLKGDSKIRKFLDRDLISAYENSEDEIKEKLRNKFKDMMYLVKVKGMGNTNNPVFVNIPSKDAKYQEFVKNEFGVDPNNFVENESMPNNKIVVVAYKGNIPFKSIGENSDIIEKYLGRDIEVFRPHLHKAWNEYPNGIYGALNSVSDMDDAALIKDDDKTRYTTEELFILSYLIDKISDKLPNIFVKDKSTLMIGNYLSKPPVYSQSGKYYFQPSVNNLVAEKDGYKFAIIDDMAKVVKLPLTDNNLNFEETVTKLKSIPEFEAVMAKFMPLIDDDAKKDIKKRLEDKNLIENILLELANKSRKKKRIIKSDYNKNIAQKIKEFYDLFIEG